MMGVIDLVLLLLGLLAGCGDVGVPPAPDRVPSPVDSPGDVAPESEQEETETNDPPASESPMPAGGLKYAECSEGDKCVAGFAFFEVHYIVFPEASNGFDPSTSRIEGLRGSYDVDFFVLADGDHVTPSINQALDFPVNLGDAGGFGFLGPWRELEWYSHFTDPSGTYPDFECRLLIYPTGYIVGALLRDEHTLVCSTKNWADGQEPSESGLLITFDFCTSDEIENCEFERPPSPL